MRAGIVGGGIAGLTAAIALRAKGWQVTVYERAPEFTDVGAGLTLQPNALAALDSIGIGADIRARACPDRSGAIRNMHGRDLVTRRLSDLIVIHRAELVHALSLALPADTLRPGARIVSVTADGLVESESDTSKYDLVVVADGVHSRVRQQLWPDEGAARRTGITAWRWIVDAPPPDFVGAVFGREAEVGILPLAGGRTYVYAAARPGVDDLDHFSDWIEPIPALIAATDPAAIISDELLEIRVPKSLVRGRVALIGDAAHAMRPHLGQGAGLAIEDAVTLAAYAHDLPAYSKARRRRVQVVAGFARHATKAIMPKYRSLTAMRDGAMWLTPDALALSSFNAVARWRPPS